MLNGKTMSKPLLLLCACMLALSGCLVGPDFHRPKITSPSSWFGPTAQMSFDTARQAELTRWWQTFNDPMLSSLIDRAVISNLDLQQAQARVLQARANRGIVAAGSVALRRHKYLRNPQPLCHFFIRFVCFSQRPLPRQYIHRSRHGRRDAQPFSNRTRRCLGD